jgi:hypothetical protein
MENSELNSRGNGGLVKRSSESKLSRTSNAIDDTRRPVWLEATESFYKKLNRIAKECQVSRYEALSKGLDALFRETQVRRSALNRNIKSPGQSEVFRRAMGQVSRNCKRTSRYVSDLHFSESRIPGHVDAFRSRLRRYLICPRITGHLY